jgi:hypothetical protein
MRNERTHIVVALIFGAGAQVACSGGGNLNIGNTSTVGANLSDYAGTWDGYAQAYSFLPDGSDHVRLTIAANGQGTLQLGDAPLLPAPTDQNVGFPTEAAAANLISGPRSPVSILNEGVLYPIHNAQVQTGRIQAGLKPNDYYAAWCALQTPVANSHLVLSATNGALIVPLAPNGGTLSPDPGDGGSPSSSSNPDAGYPGGSAWYADAGSLYAGEVITTYNCAWTLGNLSSDVDGIPQNCAVDLASALVSVDCGKLALCAENVCACPASGCTSGPAIPDGSTPAQYPVELDGTLTNGSTLMGTLAQSNSDLRITVVLTKQ